MMRKEYIYHFECRDCKQSFESEDRDEKYCTKCGSENLTIVDKEELELLD